MIDFTDLPCRKKTYAGANGSKLCVMYQGVPYMLKFPAAPSRNKAISYANGCISEYLGCHIFELIGIPVQETLLGLYRRCGKEKIVVACRDFTCFNHLMEIIESDENIRLAYRTIKRNTGSNTAGVDKRTIAELAKLSEEDYVRLIRKQFSNYHPRPVRRVEIPKPNGKTRPLGIPTIVD